MRTAETILGVIRDRGRRRLPLEDIYRQLFNRDPYLRAYGRLYRNNGAMTPGVTAETVDAMSLEKIDAIINALRYERYRWTPVRRTLVPEKSGKMRPLGLPTWSDKLLQEVIRSILEAYYEPQFSQHSHGFRPGRGCHTALGEITKRWKGVKWYLEGDIAQCFDQISHEWLLSHIPMENPILHQWLKAGFMEKSVLHATEAGTPQGAICSPVLANLALDGLEAKLRELYPKATARSRRAKVNLARFADDFVITGSSKELLETEVKPLVEQFFAGTRAGTLAGEDRDHAHQGRL